MQHKGNLGTAGAWRHGLLLLAQLHHVQPQRLFASRCSLCNTCLSHLFILCYKPTSLATDNPSFSTSMDVPSQHHQGHLPYHNRHASTLKPTHSSLLLAPMLCLILHPHTTCAAMARLQMAPIPFLHLEPFSTKRIDQG